METSYCVNLQNASPRAERTQPEEPVPATTPVATLCLPSNTGKEFTKKEFTVIFYSEVGEGDLTTKRKVIQANTATPTPRTDREVLLSD